MTPTQQAISLAIEKEYMHEEGHKTKLIPDVGVVGYSRVRTFSEVFLDPLFWQALGRALGWQHIVHVHKYVGHSLDKEWTEPAWLYHWHRFIDHLASNGDTDTFFQEILKDK